MLPLYRFRDEWLIGPSLKIPGVTLAFIGEMKRRQKPYLSQALIDANLATSEMLGEAVFAAYRVRYLELTQDLIDPAALALVPEGVCRRRLLLPFQKTMRSIDVVMANPLDLDALDEVQSVTGRRPAGWYCVPVRLNHLIGEAFARETLQISG